MKKKVLYSEGNLVTEDVSQVARPVLHTLPNTAHQDAPNFPVGQTLAGGYVARLRARFKARRPQQADTPPTQLVEPYAAPAVPRLPLKALRGKIRRDKREPIPGSAPAIFYNLPDQAVVQPGVVNSMVNSNLAKSYGSLRAPVLPTGSKDAKGGPAW